MSNYLENKNGYTHDNAHTGRGVVAAAAGGAAAVRAGGYTSAFESAPTIIQRAAFNGLLTNKLLTTLPGEDFARLLPHLEPVSLASVDTVYDLEDDAQFAYFPEGALISQLHVLSDGSTIEAAMTGKDGMVGLAAVFGVPAPSCWTRVAIGGSALRIRTETLREEFARGGALQRLLLGYASALMAQLAQRAVCNGRHSMMRRTSCWLLMAHDRTGEASLALTHEQIAHHLGTRRAGITVIANDLRDRGCISYSRGMITVIDRRGLEAAACECYGELIAPVRP
jgi:CRP-like cAMP-binding protein